MDMLNSILKSLIELENSLKCSICAEKCLEPVRIKTCGHYLCSQCLKASKKNHNCPKCNEFYELKHLDYDNIAKATETELLKLRDLLEHSIGTVENQGQFGQNVPKPLETSGESTILYNGNEYHVNFIGTRCKTNAKGETPLHLACKRKRFDEVKILVESKVDINAKDYAGWAPLHEAVQSQSLEIIEYLLQNKCLIDIPGAEYVTPLHQAASLNNIDIVKLLLKYDADKNAVDYTGLKPEESTKNQKIIEVLKTHKDSGSKSKLFEVFLPGKVSLYCHSVDEHVKKKLQGCKNIHQVVEKLEVKQNLTHFLIKKTHKLSFKIMQAMLEGLQFLTEDSVGSYIKGNYFINIPNYVFLENNPQLNRGIQKAMLSALLKLPKLFDGINFYIEDHTVPVDIYRLKAYRNGTKVK